MSGGSWGYMYRGLDEVADALKNSEYPHRRVLAPLFRKLGEIMHDVEWLDSCDYGIDNLPNEERLIRELLGEETYKDLMLQDIEARHAKIAGDIDKLKSQKQTKAKASVSVSDIEESAKQAYAKKVLKEIRRG